LDDPAAMGSHGRTEPFIIYPEMSAEYDELVDSATDQNAVTVAQVPLLKGAKPIGGLGIIHYGMRPWQDREISAITAIATILAQLWGRTDAETKVLYQAYNDELTTLPNRAFLTEHLADLADGCNVAMLAIDIDNMKVINDGLDFEAGNAFLVGMAERLRSMARPDDLVVRLQGDQFAVLVHDATAEQVQEMANRFVSELGESVAVGGSTIARSVSIGVASAVIDDGPGQLLAEADAALNTAKAQGKRRAVVYDDSMRSKTLANYELEIELRRALDEGELALHYQPEYHLDSGRLVAVEALLRWQHPVRGLVSAGAFIEVAEESGLVVEIGDFVLDEAIRQLSVWQADHPDLEMWINISPAQLMSRDLPTQVEEALTRHGVPADRICLELTEHAVLGDIEFTRGSLRRLRAMGVRLALDDFGTGYSSMKQLKSLPINTLKIDMSFVAGLGVSDYDTAIVDAAITLAEAFKLETVAEGIENADQLAELRRRGCTTGQGYYLARPASPADVEELLGQIVPVDEAATA
jgi:diguanylate cyclase (GGDEF)-like protein